MNEISGSNSEPSDEKPSTESWIMSLEQSLERIENNPGDSRSWSFDMDDRPELTHSAIQNFPTLAGALQFLHDHLSPTWQSADREAIRFRKNRRWVAMAAIWPGTAAILLAIIQLVLSQVVPHLAFLATVLEIATIFLALIAVTMGVTLHYHHRWLTRRQAAERLRSLKFQSLGWHELWCDNPAWKKRVVSQVDALKNLSAEQSEKWSTATDDVTPDVVVDPGCDVNSNELQALASYYQIKRLRYQKAYFDRQSQKADYRSWSSRWKISLIFFFASVAVVLLHGLLALILSQFEASGSESVAATGKIEHEVKHSLSVWHKVEVSLVGLAAILPVLGFGIRAWNSAFEFPRSRNLFRAKSSALDEPINAIVKDSSSLTKTMHHICESEHFFVGEHREWCRLQVESEWYV